MDHLVLSPHPDDAVWSLGGALARWRAGGASCTVLTVFDGPGPAGGKWRQIADPEVRREEDARALKRLDCDHISLGLPDAALRADASSGPRYKSLKRVFGPMHPDDEDVLARLRELLEPIVRQAGTVHAPLAAGHHVDHRIVRSASGGPNAPRTSWYEDFPYELRSADRSGLVAVHEPLEPGQVMLWAAAAAEYATQAEALLGGTGPLRRRIAERAADHGLRIRAGAATRHWQPAG